MEYNRIPVVLKRYSFASKMQACTIESMKTMDFMSTVSPEILRTLILPWDIETFVIFAVKAQEYNNLDIRDKNGKYFYEIMQSIYKYKDPNKLQKNDDFTTRIIMHSALTQFDLQENQEYKYYRYNYFFSLKNEEVDMSYVFEQKFATVYKGNIIKNLIMDCQSYTKYRPNETTGGIFVSWRRKEELPTGA